jgi:predicted dehydrogenase
MSAMKVCVIGLGPIGNLHASIYREDEMVDLAGVCDLIEDRACQTGERLGVPWFTDTAEMLGEVGPDLCSVATGGYEYGSDHAEPTVQALEAGCHVLCEKPISNELEPAVRMVATARERGLCLGVDFNHRFTPAARQAEKWLADGRIGDLLFCNMALWIGKFQELESVYYHLKALNPHSIDMMRHFCGDIARVQCFAMKAPGRNLWSTASINMEFASGAVGHLTSSYDIERGHPMERCEVAGTKGRFVIDDMWRESTLYPAGDLEKRVFTNPVFGGYRGFDDTFRERIRSFVRQVAAKTPPEQIDGSGADALAGLKVILAAIRSLDTGKVVEVAEIG